MTAPRLSREWREIAVRHPSGRREDRQFRPLPRAPLTIAEASALFSAGQADIETIFREDGREVYRVRRAELT